MFYTDRSVNNYVVKVDEAPEVPKDGMHQAFERGWCVTQTESHYVVLRESIPYCEGFLLMVLFTGSQPCYLRATTNFPWLTREVNHPHRDVIFLAVVQCLTHHHVRWENSSHGWAYCSPWFAKSVGHNLSCHNGLAVR